MNGSCMWMEEGNFLWLQPSEAITEQTENPDLDSQLSSPHAFWGKLDPSSRQVQSAPKAWPFPCPSPAYLRTEVPSH